MKVFTLTHEHRYGFDTYSFSSDAKRDEFAEKLMEENQADFDNDRDFLTYDEGEIDEPHPCSRK